MAKLKAIAAAPEAVNLPTPVALAEPSPAAKALAFESGANIVGMMQTLVLQLTEAKHALAAIISSTPPGDPSLWSLQYFMLRLCGFLGQTYVCDPSGGG